MSDPKWKLFERIVTAISKLKATGAIVKWNDEINGRQFDVTIRFKYGLHDYLTVIECRDQKDAVKATDIDAFVTKARDAGANKAILVTSSDFQSGCYKVANEHDIDLVTLKEVNELPPEVIESAIGPALNIYCLELVERFTKRVIRLPEKRGMADYVIKAVYLEHSSEVGKKLRLISLINGHLKKEHPVITAKEQQFIIKITAEDAYARIPAHLPDVEPTLHLAEVRFKARIIPVRLIKGNCLDPRLYKSFEYENLTSKEATTIDHSKIKVGFDTVFEAGRFYDEPLLEFYYYCNKIEGDDAHLTLVESYQHGCMLSVRFTIHKDAAMKFLPVSDKKTIKRLKILLATIPSE